MRICSPHGCGRKITAYFSSINSGSFLKELRKFTNKLSIKSIKSKNL